jgi:uncharacterized membrane protein (DUF373 family)
MTKKREVIVEITIATIMITLMWMGFFSAKTIIMNILLFIVFVELIRMLVSFISEGKAMKIRYLIDGSIAFLLREMIIEMTSKNDINHKYMEIGLIIIVLIFLFIFRLISTKFSPKREE